MKRGDNVLIVSEFSRIPYQGVLLRFLGSGQWLVNIPSKGFSIPVDEKKITVKEVSAAKPDQ